MVHVASFSKLQVKFELETAKAAASKLNTDLPGIIMNIEDNRKTAIACSSFMFDTLDFIKAFPSMTDYITWSAYEFIEYYNKETE